MWEFDVRLVLAGLWMLAGFYALFAGLLLLSRRVRLMLYLRARQDAGAARVIQVTITAEQESIASGTQVTQAVIRIVKAASIVAIGAIVVVQIVRPDAVSLPVRQWVTTIAGMLLALGLDAVLYNDLKSDDRLAASVAAGKITEGD